MKTICLLVTLLLSASPLALAVAPTVTTVAADHVGPVSAGLNCTIVVNATKADVYYEYGTVSGNLDKTTPVRHISGNVTRVPLRAGPLTPSTKYFFRVKASNADGPSVGSELSFTTEASGGAATLTPRVVAVVGQPVPNEAAGVTYASVKTAAGAFGGKLAIGRTKVPAIFAADGSVRIKVGDAVPTIAGSVLLTLGDPSGDAALAKLKRSLGVATAQNDSLLLAGLQAGPVRVAARMGVETANVSGVSVKRFGAIDGNGAVLFFQATLQGTGVTAANDSAICAALADGSVRVIVREGQTLGASTVKSIAVLVGAAGSLAEGRWRVASDKVGVRVTDAARVQHFFIVSSTSADATDWTPMIATGATLPAPAAGAVVKAFGLPGFGGDGPALPVTLTVGTAGITAPNDNALIRAAAGGLTVLAQEGSAAPDGAGAALPGVTFKAFKTPAAGLSGLTVFAATLKGASGTAVNGLWLGKDAATLKLLARGGETAPGGGTFASFTSIALPDGAASGPIFLGKLTVDSSVNISAANNTGVWAVNSTGSLIRILRTGDHITNVAGAERIIKSFTALLPAVQAPGAANGYDDAGKLAALVTFTDRTLALVEFTIP